jgi:hypothetical protein
MGRIGTALARRAHYGFDTRIVAADAKPIGKPDFVDALHDPRFSKAQMTAFPQEPLGIGCLTVLGEPRARRDGVSGVDVRIVLDIWLKNI